MIEKLADGVVSWPTLLAIFLLFGFAPGASLRLIVLAFPPGDPRRRELLAELYAVPRIDRPFWVLEQLEVALFEGVGQRVTAISVEHRRSIVAAIIAPVIAVGGLWLGIIVLGTSPVEVAHAYYRAPGLLFREAQATLLVALAAFCAAMIAGLLVSFVLAAVRILGDLAHRSSSNLLVPPWCGRPRSLAVIS